jgi:hypothetical protein
MSASWTAPQTDYLDTWLFTDGPAAFTQDQDLVARDVELFQCFANDFLRNAIAVRVGGVPCVETTIIRCFKKL